MFFGRGGELAEGSARRTWSVGGGGGGVSSSPLVTLRAGVYVVESRQPSLLLQMHRGVLWRPLVAPSCALPASH